MSVTALDVVAARRRIRDRVRVTPLHESAWLSSVAGARVWLKLESVQLTGSFKIRGAFNALLQLAAGTDLKGGPYDEKGFEPAKAGPQIVTASAGNHGRAIAYAAEALGFHATVFTPKDAPDAKVGAIRRHGATLRHEAADYDEAEITAKAFARETSATFVSAYNHPAVVAGAGTIALEILEMAPDVDTLVVPVGGGGLIGGMAVAAKAISPSIRIVGVELEVSNAFQVSLRNGRITVITAGASIADGLGGNMDPDTITFEIVQRAVDDMVTVSETELADAIRGLVREEHLIAEGAGAAAAAALLAGKAGRGRRIVAVLSGANIDAARVARLLTA
jgi:threonine dehydratase